LAMVIPRGLMEASVTRSFYCWRNQRGREVSAVTRSKLAGGEPGVPARPSTV
jgi:hypothetical protein